MQMGKFPKPYKKGKERCSLSTNQSPVCVQLDDTPSPRLRSGTRQVPVHWARRWDEPSFPSNRHVVEGVYYLFRRNLLKEGAMTCVFGRKCGYFQAKQKQQQLLKLFPMILISGAQKGNLEKGSVMRLSVLLFPHSWRLSRSKGSLCVGL